MSTPNEPIIRRTSDDVVGDRPVVHERDRVVERPVVHDRVRVVNKPVLQHERVVERKPVVQRERFVEHQPVPVVRNKELKIKKKKHFSKKWLALGSLVLLGFLLSSLLPSHLFTQKTRYPVVEYERPVQEYRVETDYRSAPHRFETESWRETEPATWSSNQATAWFKSVLPSYLRSSRIVRPDIQDVEIDRKTQELIDRFERSGVTGTMLAEFLKHGVVDKDNDLFRQLLKIEEQGFSDYLMTELRKFTPRMHTTASRRTDDHNFLHLDTDHGMLHYLLYWPIKLFGKSVEGFLKTILTVFELAGILLIGMSLLSPIDSQKSLLRSTSMIFDEILLSFFNIFNKHITMKSDTSTTSSGEATKPHSGMYSFLKYGVAGPLAFIFGPFLYLTCFFYNISRSMSHRISRLAPPVIGLLLFKMLAPSWLWNPVSFVLWHVIGGYGAITLLLRSYRSIFALLKTKNMMGGDYSTSRYTKSTSIPHNERVINPISSSIPSSNTGYGIETAPTAFPQSVESAPMFESNIDNIDSTVKPSIVHRATNMMEGDLRDKDRDYRDNRDNTVIKRNYVAPENISTSAGVGTTAGINRLGTSGA